MTNPPLDPGARRRRRMLQLIDAYHLATTPQQRQDILDEADALGEIDMACDDLRRALL